MPKSFLVRRIGNPIGNPNTNEDSDNKIEYDNNNDIKSIVRSSYIDSEISSQVITSSYADSETSQVICNCSMSTCDSISSCSSDSFISPLYDTSKSYSKFYQRYNQNISINTNKKHFLETLETKSYDAKNELYGELYEKGSANIDINKTQLFPVDGTLNEKPFNCLTCGKSFRLSSTLCRHKIIHTKQRPHKCYLCYKSFNRSSTLKTHLRTHNQDKEFICKICGKGFHQKGNLRNHCLIHTGEKPYQCRVCSKSFNKLSNLKFHMHCHTDQKPYRCRFCKVSMTRRGELKQHIAVYHPEEVEKK